MRHRGHEQLFSTWRARRDEASFRALCERHAPVVHAACMRLDSPDADEAAQAVFIVLAQRPEAVGDPTRLVGWLLGTARRVVANQKRGEERRRRHEQEAAMEHARQRAEEADPAWAAARPLLDEALASLSAARREAMVRFFLEGRSQAVVAGELGCSVNAVKSRVHESLALLRSWFARRGVTLGLTALATGLTSEASAANPALVIACTKAGLAPTAAPAAAALAKGVAPVMTLSLTTATTAAAIVLGSSLVAAMVVGNDRKPANHGDRIGPAITAQERDYKREPAADDVFSGYRYTQITAATGLSEDAASDADQDCSNEHHHTCEGPPKAYPLEEAPTKQHEE